MRRVLLWAAVVLTALLLQSTVFAQVKLAGAKPELIYLITVAMAVLEGPAAGAVAGFAGGMAQDFLLNQPKGITALTLTLLGYAVGMLRSYVASPSPSLTMIVKARVACWQCSGRVEGRDFLIASYKTGMMAIPSFTATQSTAGGLDWLKYGKCGKVRKGFCPARLSGLKQRFFSCFPLCVL